MNSMATSDFVFELDTFLAKDIPKRAAKSISNRMWTEAVYKSLTHFCERYRWSINPKERCYVGEYLCDFTLHEEGYGCRVACESQWQHWNGSHQAGLEWAFDKLRGVKSDVKLFVFEGTEEEWQGVINAYLTNYAQLSPSEAYLSLRWQGNQFVTSWWKPKQDGKQTIPINFESFAALGAPTKVILDTHGNNAAVQCFACGQAFIVSAFLNKLNGRTCPHCKGSIGIFDGGRYRVSATK